MKMVLDIVSERFFLQKKTNLWDKTTLHLKIYNVLILLQCFLSFEILNNNSIVHYSVLHIGMRGNNNVCRIALELGPY